MDAIRKAILARLHLKRLSANALPPAFFQVRSQIRNPKDIRKGAVIAAIIPVWHDIPMHCCSICYCFFTQC